MKRLIEKNINTSEEYDRIYFERQGRGIDSFDEKRWKQMLTYYRGGRLVDLGCLDSLITVLAKMQYPESECWGIDQASEAIKDMQLMYPSIYWKSEDLNQTHFPANYFSYVTLGEVIEHLEKPELAVKEAIRILRKKGVLVLSTPYNEKHNEVDGERHLWSFDLDDIRTLLSSYGSVKIRLFPRIHIPYTKYHHKNIIAFCTKK